IGLLTHAPARRGAYPESREPNHPSSRKAPARSGLSTTGPERASIMHGYPRSTFARITLLALLLGLAMAAPAGVAAQDDDTDDAPFAEITFAPDEDAGPDDANAVPPDCDDGGWANL